MAGGKDTPAGCSAPEPCRLLKPFGMQLSNFENTIYLAATDLEEKVNWMCRLGTLLAAFNKTEEGTAVAEAQPPSTLPAQDSAAVVLNDSDADGAREEEAPAAPAAAGEQPMYGVSSEARERALSRASSNLPGAVVLPSPEEVEALIVQTSTKIVERLSVALSTRDSLGDLQEGSVPPAPCSVPRSTHSLRYGAYSTTPSLRRTAT